MQVGGHPDSYSDPSGRQSLLDGKRLSARYLTSDQLSATRKISYAYYVLIAVCLTVITVAGQWQILAALSPFPLAAAPR